MRKTSFFIGLLFVVSIAVLACSRNVVPSVGAVGKIKPYDTATFNYIFVEAVKQKVMGNGGDALKLLEQALKINPESDAAYFQMAQILIAAGDLINGKKYALKAYSHDNRNFWYLMMIAGTYYQEKNLDSAIMFYEKAVKEFPEKESLQVNLANLYSEHKDFNKATLIFETLDRKYGVNEASSLGTVKNLMWAEKWEEALVRAKFLLELKPDEILYNGLLAEIYRGKGEPAKALEVYNKLIERNPDNPEIQLSLCDFLIEEKKYEELLSLLNTVTINSKIAREDKISLFARLAEIPDIYLKYGDQLQVSLMVLEAAYGNDDLIMLLRPEILVVQGKLDAAAARLSEIIKKRPENYYAWEKLLIVYLQKKDYVILEKKGEECATRFNRSFLVKLLYATAANENKNYPVAIEELRKANILAGDNEEMLMQVLTLKADVFYRMKEYEKAFGAFEEALKKNSDDLTLLNNYAYYLAEQNMNLKEAEEMARRVIEKEDSNKTFLDTYAWVLYKRGKYREAAKIMEAILGSGENIDAEFSEHYGYILKKRRDCKNAIKNWETAIQLDSTKVNLIKEIEECKK